MFEATEKTVIVGQLGCELRGNDVSMLQASDGVEGVALEDVGVETGVDELKALDEELDVADATGGIFDVLSRGVSDFTGGELTEAADRGHDGLGIV